MSSEITLTSSRTHILLLSKKIDYKSTKNETPHLIIVNWDENYLPSLVRRLKRAVANSRFILKKKKNSLNFYSHTQNYCLYTSTSVSITNWPSSGVSSSSYWVSVGTGKRHHKSLKFLALLRVRSLNKTYISISGKRHFSPLEQTLLNIFTRSQQIPLTNCFN